MKFPKVRRTFHPYYNWECYANGFYDVSTTPNEKDLIIIYNDFFSSKDFSLYIDLVFKDWINSCEHFLTNPNMNRVAWLGQACINYKHKVSVFNCKYIYKTLDKVVIEKSNTLAYLKIKDYLNEYKNKSE